MIAALSAVFQLPYLSSYIDLHADDLLYYAAIGDKQQLNAILCSAAACEATHAFRSNMNHQTLYTLVNGSCTIADLDGADTGNYYADSSCTQSVKFRPTPYTAFCSQILKQKGNTAYEKGSLGTEKIPADQTLTWTLPHGPRFNVGVESISSNSAPFMARANYQIFPQYWTWFTTKVYVGDCNLECVCIKKTSPQLI